MSTELSIDFAALNPQQRRAAEWQDGALLVLAGPGSGKTKVLTCRIAKLLDDSPDANFRILALTFTRIAADEMRTRVAAYVPGLEHRLSLGTFHSFCVDVLRQHGTHVGVKPDFAMYADEADLLAVLSDAVEEAKKSSDVVSDLDKKLLPVLRRLKSFLVGPDKTRGRFSDPTIDARIAAVYPAYEAQLQKRNALDFDSLIFKTHELFVSVPGIAERFRAVYPYICVDEFQDTNLAQYRLIKALTGSEFKNLFVVADDDQIIYLWNGASHKRIEEFRQDFQPDIVQLPLNYRCPPEVVEIANNLILHNYMRAPEKERLASSKAVAHDDAVRLLPQFDDVDAEVAAVAADIARRHRDELGSVAVLARTRRLLERVCECLRSQGVAAVIAQRRTEFQSTPFVWIHATLRLASERRARRPLEAVCATFATLTEVIVDPQEVENAAAGSELGYLEHWVQLVRSRASTDVANELVSLIEQHLLTNRDVRAFASEAVAAFDKRDSGQGDGGPAERVEVFANYAEDKAVWLALLSDITSALGIRISLEAFLQELGMHSKEPRPDAASVQLMTIHSAKGKEFDHVYIVGMVEDELPSYQAKKKGDTSPEMEEERRNCFVAITRAAKTLTLSYAAYYRGWRKEPSRFLREMALLA